MPTPVKIIFVSVITMMSMMLKYRAVTEDCFSSQTSVQPQERVPSRTTWESLKLVVNTLDPVMKACILNQTRKFWLLGDAVRKIIRLYVMYRDMDEVIPNYPLDMSGGNFNVQLQLCRKE